ncbi:cation diffusion facilitator family transporter [Acetitomaculum ruminis DSM 5522]|uniref:Cation diffusion facilitator family transporter n=1 Tax=Acetitomaculum ruminis DSM 5522 TaxID=1120918 RepID=A0A1I0YVM6_9FIRM|nr:cation diffusion facilitator family transporter [Acetitomaculum ruminis]SFB17242.1 cation diffusion facilitator family transporter [Acetitomaculum ruminis DSM 5522]
MSGENTKEEAKLENSVINRDKVIIKTSIIGIIANIFLASFKAFIGIVSNSIAVTLDAVNNLSDALSSVITIVGTKLAGKFPDKKHPMGYGRIEYLSAMMVSGIVLYAGITSVVESVKKIIWPEKADYSTTSLLIIAVAVLVKIVLGFYVKKKGEEVNSAALVASGADASFDAILSASVLASALVFIFTGISLEAYVGAIIAIIIVKSGVEMMIETLNDILGQRLDNETTMKIKEIVKSEEGVYGAYDLIISNYGPNKNYGSVHMELPDNMTVDQVDVITRRVQAKVFKQTGVILTGVGVYAYNTKDDEAARLRNEVQNIVLSHEWALQMHGFFVDLVKKSIRFDLVFSFDIKFSEGLKIVNDELSEKFPGYSFFITPDIDASDLE